MESGSFKDIYDFFCCAKGYRDTFVSSSKGLIEPIHEIVVDIIDRPGIIGQITTILGKNDVNIKNINVSNSREFEEGCLTITLQDLDSAVTAFELLKNSGYKVYR
jgi:prephenate dehydrogenase